MSILLLEASNIEKYFADEKILDIKSLKIYEGDRIGFVGPNGSGKTTLLNILAGELAPDGGTIRRVCNISYIRQFNFSLTNQDILGSDHVQKLGQYGVLSIADNEITSGGEATRIKLAYALSTPGQLVFADEPTSSLDIYGIKQFSNELYGLTSFILISHDRDLLNLHCNRILTIENGDIAIYEGNYDAYKQQQEAKQKRQQFEYEQYQNEKSRLQNVYKDKKSKAAKVAKKPKGMSSSEMKQRAFVATSRSFDGRQKQADQAAKAVQARIGQLDVKERPKETTKIKLDFALTDPPRNKIVLSGSDINFAYGQNTLFENAAFEIQNGARISLQGKNGSGKTTLLNLIFEGHPSIYQVPKLRIGYFRQGLTNIDHSKTVLQNALSESVQSETTVRSALARLLFTRNNINKPAGVLSGGERVKLSLAKLLVSDCNMLLMDEPTNYLDMPSLEVLQAILSEYEGTMMLVSHDKAFTDAICTGVLYIKDKGCHFWQNR